VTRLVAVPGLARELGVRGMFVKEEASRLGCRPSGCWVDGGPTRPLQGPAVPGPGLCSRRGKEADWPRPAGRLFRRLIARSGLGGPIMIVS
jgi:hypothetical protein